jgi:hypothetical protein
MFSLIRYTLNVKTKSDILGVGDFFTWTCRKQDIIKNNGQYYWQVLCINGNDFKYQIFNTNPNMPRHKQIASSEIDNYLDHDLSRIPKPSFHND